MRLALQTALYELLSYLAATRTGGVVALAYDLAPELFSPTCSEPQNRPIKEVAIALCPANI